MLATTHKLEKTIPLFISFLINLYPGALFKVLVTEVISLTTAFQAHTEWYFEARAAAVHISDFQLRAKKI